MIKYFTTALLLLLSLCAYGQAKRISGTLFGSTGNVPLSGVVITEVGTNNTTVSDADGSYTITVSGEDAQLQFANGENVTVIAVGEQSSISLNLPSRNNSLTETVVTALGIQREKKNLGYAVQLLNEAEINDVKAVNFLDNISGKVAGVNITPGPTGVGSTSKITIRGESSFSNNNPLFVVDGVPINNNTPFNVNDEAASGFQAVDFGNGAGDVNPDDVQSVTVLKGPGAAALYGTRASNGVVVITTKDGSRSKGLGISFNTTTLADKPFKLPEFQNKYGQGNSGKFEYKDGLGGGVNDNISYSYGPALDKGILVKQYDSPVYLPDGSVVRGADVAVHGGAPITPTTFNSHPDNLKDFYRTGLTTINNLAISNGNDQGSFRLSYTDMRSKSYIPGTNLDRKTVAGHFNFTPNSKIQVTATANYINTTSDNRPGNGYGSENVNYALVAWGPRSLNIDPMKTIWQPGLEGVEQYSFNTTFFDNPYLTLQENQNSLNRNRVFGNIRAAYNFTEKFSIALRSGIDYSQELRRFRRAFSTNRFKNGAYGEQDVNYREVNTDVLLTYTTSIGKDFNISVSGGANRLDQNAGFKQVQTLNLAQPGVYSLNNRATPLEVFEYIGDKGINSVYGLAKLGYKNFLFLDITGRNDWSSALATPVSAENASFFYPSFSGSFVLSNAIKLPTAINYAQARASYSQVGNDTDPYQTAGVFNSRTPYGSQPTLSEQASIANTSLLPEKVKSLEFGADVRLFRDRVSIDATFYSATTVNQIIALPISNASGYTQQVVNGSTVRNQGLEVILNLVPIRKRDFRWDATFNFSSNVATVGDLPAGTDKLTLGYNRIYDNNNQTVFVQVEEGGRIGDLYGTGYKKTEDGRYIVDAKGNFIVDNTLKKLGNYNPDFILGFSNNLKYKNWRLSFLFDWKQGGILVSRTQALAGVAGQLKETENRPDAGIVIEGVFNSGTPENPVYVKNTNPITAEAYYRSYYDRNHEENNVYDASFLKLRQFSIGYTFTKEALSHSILRGVQGMELSVIGRNIFAFSHIPHFDPEQMASQGSRFVSGVEDMSYPTTRSIGVKLGITL